MLLIDKTWNISFVICNIHTSHDELITHYPSKDSLRHQRLLSIKWEAPPIGFIKLNVDGSVLEANSVMGTGGLLRSETGDWLKGFSSYEGVGDVSSFLTEGWSEI